MTEGVEEYLLTLLGYGVAELVEALRYKSGGRGFDSQGVDFSLT
jgi:hypothetical protein